MCGIAGILNFEKNNPVDAEIIKKMIDVIRHRGPDDSGFYVQNNIGLGIARLSIIDLVGGNQPIPNEDGTIWIVFNGEIYNYRELRDELIKKGHKFTTQSDTEVILHQYEEDGPECVHRLNGMFAFAIWDVKKQKLFLARDRLGIKPLYYTTVDDKFVFGSEIKSILQVPGIEKDVDYQALYDYLSFRYVPAPGTMFRGISKLLPGNILILDGNQIETKEYWDIGIVGISAIKDDSDYILEFESLFKEAVEKRLMSDVPLGVLLSGGVDSSSVVAMMAEVGVKDIRTFSIGFREGGIYNELNDARMVAKHFNTEHHEIVIGSKEFIDFLPNFVGYTDEPVADLASVPLYYVAQLAKRDVKVVLSGEGADEIFGGYGGFERFVKQVHLVRKYQRIPRGIRGLLLNIVKNLKLSGRIREKFEMANTPLEFYARKKPYNMTNIFSDLEKRELLLPNCDMMEDSLNLIRSLYDKAYLRDPLDQVLYVYSKSWLPDNLLIKADRMTMANSIELRVPFLDYELVEFAFSLPEKMKVRKSRRKYILYQAMKERLPQVILQRKKLGFPVPAYKWLERELNDFSHDILLSKQSLISHHFNPQIMRNLLRQSENGDLESQHKVWLLIILEFWFNSYKNH